MNSAYCLKLCAAAQAIVIATAHIHWNPQLADVKHQQVAYAFREGTALADEMRAPLVICGDFNTMPTDALYSWLIAQPHFGPSGREFHMESAYAITMGKEPPFTTYTAHFVATIDYIWVDASRVAVTGVRPLPAQRDIQLEIALPNRQYSSDHLPLAADLLVTL